MTEYVAFIVWLIAGGATALVYRIVEDEPLPATIWLATIALWPVVLLAGLSKVLWRIRF